MKKRLISEFFFFNQTIKTLKEAKHNFLSTKGEDAAATPDSSGGVAGVEDEESLAE